MPSILHVDMDAFFASVEQRDHPEWRGKPVIVGADPHKRGVVSTCSYEARRFGVHSAMPSREAFRRCPQGIFVPCDMERYSRASDQVFAIFGRFSPFVQPVSIDEAFIDVSGARRLFGEAPEIARRIRAAIQEEVRITASIGVARNKFLAKLGSEAAKPNGLFVVPEEEGALIAWLGKLPIGAIWGVGKVTGAVLTRAGYRTVADIQNADLEALAALIGKNGAEQLMALAFGQDDRAVETEREDKSLSREHTFLEDCENREEVRGVLKELCEDVGARTRRHGFFATVGRIKVRWKDFTTITRQAPFAAPSRDDFSFRELAFRLFDAQKLVQPVRLIGFGVSGLTTERHEQLDLFAGEDDASREKRERLCEAVDRLRKRFGK
jgi:DNA polymerase-4